MDPFAVLRDAERIASNSLASRKQAAKAVFGDDAGFTQKLEPEDRLIRLFDSDSKLGNELRPGAGTAGSSVVCRYGRPGTQKLSAQDSALIIPWQTTEEPHDAEREFLGSSPQFVWRTGARRLNRQITQSLDHSILSNSNSITLPRTM